MEIKSKVLEILRSESTNEVKNIELSDSLTDDLGFDSLMLVSLIIGLEEEFKINFSDSELDGIALTNVSNLIEYVEDRVHNGNF